MLESNSLQFSRNVQVQQTKSKKICNLNAYFSNRRVFFYNIFTQIFYRFIQYDSVSSREKGMKRVFSFIMVYLMCAPLFLIFIPQVKGQETIIFQDDFESYQTGTFPSEGGWKLVYNGAGDQYQVITSDYAASGTKSLQMVGQYGWSAVVAKDFQSTSNLIGFEAYLMGTPGSWLSVGFGNETVQPWGRLYGAVGVNTIDGYIVAGSQNLQPCTANTWYKIRVVMDRNARTFDVWVDDQLRGSDILEANDPWEIQSLRFDVGWHQVMNYYDNVKVFELNEMPPEGGLVGYWSFDEGSGSIVHDSSGNGNQGVLNNGPVWVDGRFGKALSFDGVDDYVRIKPSLSLDVTSQITVEAWVYPRAYVDNTGHVSHIISRCDDSGGHIYVLSTYPDSYKISYSVNPDSGQKSSIADLPLNVWTHLAMTYDGSYIRLYINGELDSSYAQTGSISTTSNWLAIGCKPTGREGGSGSYAYFNGIIDEVRIYNRALSQQEIQTDMQPSWGVLTASPHSQKVVPGGGTSYTVSLNSLNLSAALSFSASTTGISGYFVPQIIGGSKGLSSTSTLFISTSTSTPCGVHTIVITATPITHDPTFTPISTQVTLEVMSGIVIAVMDACSDNKPIIGAKVVIGALSGVTGASGTLTFPTLGTGYYNVTISAKGYSGDVFTNKECPRFYKNQYLEVGKTFTGYLFPLRYKLTINVRDQFGNPVEGASGDIYDSNGHLYGAFATPIGGSLTMQNLEAATGLTMIIQKYGYETKTLTFDLTSDVTLNIVLNDLGVATTKLTVHVEHASTGVGISGATVQVAGQTGTTDRIGNAYFSGLQFKEYIVTVSKTGYATAYARITISRTSPTPTIKVNLTPEVFGLFVHVQDSFGSPVSGAIVTLPSVPGKFTDNGGNAMFTGLNSGTYTVTASKSGYGSSSTVVAIGTSNTWVTLTLQPAAMPDFTIEVEESFQKTSPGFPASYNIRLTSINGFNQRVDLLINTFPRPYHVFSPSSSVQLSPESPADITLTINTQPSDVGEHQYTIECSYLGSPKSIVHSCTVTLVVSDFDYNVKILRSRSDGDYYLFEDATFYVIITDASSINPVFIDPFSFNAQFDGRPCTDNVKRDGIGRYSYTTKEFDSTDIGSHYFTFTCQTPGGSSFIASNTISVKLHKETLKMVFSADEQYFPVDGLFYDDQDVSNNKANYGVGTKPSSGVKAYFKVSTHNDDPDIGLDEYIVQYWIYYAYNDYKILNIVPNEHEHDFESITVWVSKPTSTIPARITKMILSQHMWVNKYYCDQFPRSDELFIAVEKGGHGMMLLKELGSFYAFFELPWGAQLNPAGIFQGTFNSISSSIYSLVPAYDTTKGNVVEGFGDPSTLHRGFNYDYIFPAITLSDNKVKTILILLGYPSPETLPFYVTGYCFYLVFFTDFVSSDVLKSNDPFSLRLVFFDWSHDPPLYSDNLPFYIVAPWKRPEFLKPTIQAEKIGFVEPYPLLKGALKASMDFMLSGFIGKGEELEWASKIARIENIWIDPINVTIVDSNGRIMTNANRNMTNEIPGGSIYVMNEYFGIFFILNATDNYSIILSSDTGGEYSIELSMIYANFSVSFKANEVPMEHGSVHTYSLDWDALAKGELGTTLFVDQFGLGEYQTLHVGTELTFEQFSTLIGLSCLSPKTILAVTEPKIITDDGIFVTPMTQFILSAISERRYQQNDGFLTSATSTDIAGTFYRIFNQIHDSGWLNYTEPFCLYGLEKGTYTIEYYSIDKLGNNETINSIIVTLQDTPLPTTYSLTITTNPGGTTAPTPGTYTYTANHTVQITAIPDTGYLLDHWELDGLNAGSANPYTITMNTNHTLRAVFLPTPPPLSASLNPLSASILVGQSVTFTSTVSGGYTPYTYQWYLNGNPVSGATSPTWTFTPTTSGIYYVQLKVTDNKGNTTQSEPARITVATVPVGGYSIPINANTKDTSITPYITLLVALTIAFTTIKRKIKRK
jgi:hypothetical protein